MKASTRTAQLACSLMVVLLLIVPNVGCIGLTAQLLHAWYGGDKITAQFDGLEKKRVAVVCMSSSSSYGPDSSAEILAHNVEMMLKRNVKGIQMVHQDEVNDWIDRHDWNEIDYRDIGRGVKAEMVVAIDLSSFRMHEGPNLYKGRATVTTTVYDMQKDGERVFRRTITDFSFPQNGPATEISEAKFQRVFLMVLGQSIARYFYDYDLKEEFAVDAMLTG